MRGRRERRQVRFPHLPTNRNRPEGLVDERDRLLHFFQYLQHPDKEIREAAKRLSGYMAADENQGLNLLCL
eukprot:757559-Hanusia_phi.AAC.1